MVLSQIIATTPPAIVILLGALGYLAHIDGAGTLLVVGVVLQVLWVGGFVLKAALTN